MWWEKDEKIGGKNDERRGGNGWKNWWEKGRKWVEEMMRERAEMGGRSGERRGGNG